jgi:hypothetical protein
MESLESQQLTGVEIFGGMKRALWDQNQEANNHTGRYDYAVQRESMYS